MYTESFVSMPRTDPGLRPFMHDMVRKLSYRPLDPEEQRSAAAPGDSVCHDDRANIDC